MVVESGEPEELAEDGWGFAENEVDEEEAEVVAEAEEAEGGEPVEVKEVKEVVEGARPEEETWDFEENGKVVDEEEAEEVAEAEDAELAEAKVEEGVDRKSVV